MSFEMGDNFVHIHAVRAFDGDDVVGAEGVDDVRRQCCAVGGHCTAQGYGQRVV